MAAAVAMSPITPPPCGRSQRRGLRQPSHERLRPVLGELGVLGQVRRLQDALHSDSQGWPNPARAESRQPGTHDAVGIQHVAAHETQQKNDVLFVASRFDLQTTEQKIDHPEHLPLPGLTRPDMCYSRERTQQVERLDIVPKHAISDPA